MVRDIGFDMANSRRADSGDPVGAGDGRRLHPGSGSDRGRRRKRRASSATSWKSTRPQALADDVEQVAVLAGRRVGPFAGTAFAGRVAGQPHEHRAALRIPGVADLPVVSDPAPVREIMSAHRLGFARETRCASSATSRSMSRGRPLGDAGNRVALQNLGEDRRPGRIDRNKEPQFPRDDLAEQTVGAQPVTHGVGEARQFDPVRTHHARAAKLKTLGEIENGLAVHQRGEGGVRR